MVRLKADPNAGGVSYNGQEYPMVKGCVEVPDEAAEELLGFGWGFTLASRQPAPEAPEEQPVEDAAPEGKGKK
jgi:hypothetical protein